MQLYQGDCLDILKGIPDDTADLVLTDPPYNMNVTHVVNGKKVPYQWDKIDNYIPWCMQWLRECHRVLKPNGVLYFWHSSIPTIAELMMHIQEEDFMRYVSFCIWDKGGGYRARCWKNLHPDGRTPLRSWFNRCEYCIHFFNRKEGHISSAYKQTGTCQIEDTPECFQDIKQWYSTEKDRLGLTDREIKEYYTSVTGKKPHMFGHYFSNNQFEIPSKKVWETVFLPLGFSRSWDDLHANLEQDRESYAELKREFESQRHYHYCDSEHCNIWQVPPVPTQGRKHTCQKPLSILKRLINVSCKAGGMVLDPFMGSGSTGVACIQTGRDFIGIERDESYFTTAKNWIEETMQQERILNV